MHPAHTDNSLAYRFFSGLAALVLRYRWLVLAGVLATTGYLVYQTTTLTIDSSNDLYFVEGDRQLILNRKFERMFGNDDFVLVLVESDDFFQTDIIRRFWQLAEDLEENTPHVGDATWLGTAEFIEGREHAIEIYELLDDVPETPVELARFREKSFSEPLYLNNLISPSGHVAGLLLEMIAYPDDLTDPRKNVAPAVAAIVAKPEYEGLRLHVIGGPVMDHAFDHMTTEDTTLLMTVASIIQALILFWVGRGVRGVLVPLVIVNGTVLWTFGMIGVYGFTLNLFVIVVPILLVCVGIGDSMHLISEFHDQHDSGLNRRDAMIRATGVIGLPCLLTSLTTAAGFLSFLSGRIQPFREMGIYAASGCMLALLLTFLLVPLFYSWGREPRRTAGRDEVAKPGDSFDRLLMTFHRIVTTRPRTVIAVFAVLTAAAAIGVPRLEVENSTVKMLAERVPLRQTYEWVDSNMGGSASVEIMLDTATEQGALDPEFLKRLAALEQFVKSHPLTTTTSSMLDILRQMRRAFHENRQEYYSIPETRPEASQYMLMYEMSGGTNKEKFVTYGYDVARMTVRTQALDSKDVGVLMRDIRARADELFPGDDVSIEFSGHLTWVKAMTDRVGESQRASFGTAAIVITLIMIVVLRSIPLGLISMLPNIFPVLMTLGLMGYAGIYMDMALMTISAVIIGVAVDDSIHFFVRFRREFEIHNTYSDALAGTLASAGRPILFTTMTLSLGFAVLVLSSMSGLIKTGFFMGYAFTWALLADLLLAPAILLLFKPLGPERPEGSGGPSA